MSMTSHNNDWGKAKKTEKKGKKWRQHFVLQIISIKYLSDYATLLLIDTFLNTSSLGNGTNSLALSVLCVCVCYDNNYPRKNISNSFMVKPLLAPHK